MCACVQPEPALLDHAWFEQSLAFRRLKATKQIQIDLQKLVLHPIALTSSSTNKNAHQSWHAPSLSDSRWSPQSFEHRRVANGQVLSEVTTAASAAITPNHRLLSVRIRGRV